MRFASREDCTRAALERNVKLIEAGEIAQFQCIQSERPPLFDNQPGALLDR